MNIENMHQRFPVHIYRVQFFFFFLEHVTKVFKQLALK